MSDKKNSFLKRKNIWFFLLLKRQLKRPFSWIILAFMTLSVMALSYVTAPSSDNKRVLLYSESYNDDLCYDEMLIQNLIASYENEDTIFEFAKAQSKENLIQEVTAGTAECGFVLTEKFNKSITLGQTDNIIEYIESTYTTKGVVAKETVFSEFFEIYGKVIIENEQGNIFVESSEELKEILDEEYERLLSGDEIFNAQYLTIEGDLSELTYNKLQSVRGLIMILITMALLLNGSEKFYGSQVRVIRALPSLERTYFELLLYITGIIVPAVWGFALIRLLDPAIDITTDLLIYVIFVFIAIIWTYLLGKLLNNGIGYMAWILSLLIVQLLLCPVWQDISQYMPSLEYVSYILPAGAYLKVLNFVF